MQPFLKRGSTQMDIYRLNLLLYFPRQQVQALMVLLPCKNKRMIISWGKDGTKTKPQVFLLIFKRKAAMIQTHYHLLIKKAEEHMVYSNGAVIDGLH